MAKRFFAACLIGLLFPYIVTLAWTGTVEGTERKLEVADGRRVLLDRGISQDYMNVEEYLIGVVAKQMPADYGAEALRAQAVIARTYVYSQMGQETEIPESALDLDYLEEKQLESLWGSEKAAQYYKNMEIAVKSTSGMVMTYEDNLITPLFHRASIGKTRAGDESHPYLQSVDSLRDVEAENYLQVLLFTKEQLVEKINAIPEAAAVTADQIPSTIQVVEKDDAGYISKIQIGTKTYTGEEIQYALSLPSPGFTLEEYEGQMRAVCKGIGHGYGLSQYGAKVKAEEGWTAEEILAYFYKNIVLISE